MLGVREKPRAGAAHVIDDRAAGRANSAASVGLDGRSAAPDRTGTECAAVEFADARAAADLGSEYWTGGST